MDSVRGIETSVLLEIYGRLLTGKQRDVLDMHLNLDYSLSEIAENQGISRQAALDSIKRGMARLNELEAALGIYARFGRSMQIYEEMEALARRGDRQELLDAIQRARSVWEDRE